MLIKKLILWCNDTQHNHTQYNDIHHNNTQQNGLTCDIQQNDIQHDNTQYNKIKMNVIMLSVPFFYSYA